MVFWGRSSWCLWFSGAAPSWAAKRFRGRFHQGSAKVPPRFHQGFTKAPPRFHQGSPSVVVSLVLWGRSTKVLQVSWCLWLFGGDPSWAATRFRGRFHQGSANVLQVSWCLYKRFREGSTKVSPRFHEGCASSCSLRSPGADPFPRALWYLVLFVISGEALTWLYTNFRTSWFAVLVQGITGEVTLFALVSQRVSGFWFLCLLGRSRPLFLNCFVSGWFITIFTFSEQN